MSTRFEHCRYVTQHKSYEAQAQYLANDIAMRLQQAIENKGYASIAFSGGSTPKYMLQQLAHKALAWENVFITLVDERCVNEASDRSNTAMLKKTLLDKLSSKPKFYPLYIESESDVNTAKRMQTFPEYFDVVHLGMGEDAHTASFFPDSDNIEAMLDIHQKQRFFSTQSLSSQEKRLTWSLTALINAHYIVVQIVGKSKKDVMDKAIERVTKEGAVPHVLRVTYPILAVLERTQIKSKKGVPLAIDYADIS